MKKKWQELQQQVGALKQANNPCHTKSKNLVGVRENGETSNTVEGRRNDGREQLKPVANPEMVDGKRNQSR